MSKEWNLSDEIIEWNFKGWLDVNNVKEFIRRLKEDYCMDKRMGDGNSHVILIEKEELDKLAGRSLTDA